MFSRIYRKIIYLWNMHKLIVGMHCSSALPIWNNLCQYYLLKLFLWISGDAYYTFSLCIEISYVVIETWAFILIWRKTSFCLKAIFHDAKYTSRMKNTLVKGICHAMTLNNILVYNILEQITNAKSPTSQQNSL